jgi:hypothetical protein
MIARAALGVEETEKSFEGFGVGAIPEVGAVAAHSDQVFVFQLVEVMRERGVGDVDLGLDIADDHAFGLSGHKELHDAEARFRAHSREHIGKASDLSRSGAWHISIILEI